MTATAKHNLYDLVAEYYTLLGSGQFANLTKYNADNMTLDTFYYATAHKQEDLIRRLVFDKVLT